MPNFWPYFDLASYGRMPVGSPIRYTYDGQVIQIKKAPPANWPTLPGGNPMPHDPLLEGGGYYQHHAKWGAYQYWPWQVTNEFHDRFPVSQNHVTMSGAVINNVQSLNELKIPEFGDKYANADWAAPWRLSYDTKLTSSGYRALDLIHFTGHHSMGPLVGEDYFLKDLIYHNATLAQNYFLGGSFRSSKGFFPTELGFSERLIPALKKLGVEWSVVGNVHLSRTLVDYPYLNDPGVDTLISPPNRADLQNESPHGGWVSLKMTNEQQVTHNKFPFASIPHWVRYVDPNTGEENRLAAIPVEQASSWEEGYLGSTKADPLKPFEGDARALGRTQYFVIAHDGDNSSGRAGSMDTWQAAYNVTYSDKGVEGMGIDEYLKRYPIPQDDVVHIQDGSWIDTRDSSSDPSWYHWRMPFGVWSGQLHKMNEVNGTSYEQRTDWNGKKIGHMVSFEYGYNYLERNFALLMPALNFAKTAEQIWLDGHPRHWQPASELDRQVTYSGNQLNPWMISYPTKGDEAKDYAGGACPAELAWYFLLPALDSGFGYYDENVDDHVKPTLSFNQSLHFSKPFVETRKAQDRTGPSVWWPQRYPYNPGSANVSKAEGWAALYASHEFAIYTYAYDLNGIKDIQVKVRTHRDKRINPRDIAHLVYNPERLKSFGKKLDPSKVSSWRSVPLKRRSLARDMNGVAWQEAVSSTMKIVPAQEIGDLYYAYFNEYRDQIIDYYIEATDTLGNVTRSEIQQVYVGSGLYRKNGNGKIVEDPAGDIEGMRPFFTDEPPQHAASVYIEPSSNTVAGGLLQRSMPGNPASWSAESSLTNLKNGYFHAYLTFPAADQGVKIRYRETLSGKTGGFLPSDTGIIVKKGVFSLNRFGQLTDGVPKGVSNYATVYYSSPYSGPTYMHYRPVGGVWTQVPGIEMKKSDIAGFLTLDLDTKEAEGIEAVFTDGKGKWDNNGGSNYRFPIGVSYLKGGKVYVGKPN
jgi:hypothetical protein